MKINPYVGNWHSTFMIRSVHVCYVSDILFDLLCIFLTITVTMNNLIVHMLFKSITGFDRQRGRKIIQHSWSFQYANVHTKKGKRRDNMIDKWQGYFVAVWKLVYSALAVFWSFNKLCYFYTITIELDVLVALWEFASLLNLLSVTNNTHSLYSWFILLVYCLVQ